ncbi:hypothetical protein [Thermosipho atlanticus]|nr:hypothetical protein [Thermosipho atlanticus]
MKEMSLCARVQKKL